MTAPRISRSFAAALLAACVGLAALPGCGGSAPQADKKDDKKDDKKADPGAAPGPGPNPGPTPPGVPPKSTLGDIDKDADDAATAFRRDLVHGTAKAESLSAAFLKVVGKPLLFESDKAKGYSPDSAVSWMKKAGEGVNFGPELQRQQAGEVAYLRGVLQKVGLPAPGAYSLRLVKEGGAWKVDWLALSSVDAAALATAPTPEGAAQGFAVAAFVESITDLNAMPKDERAPLIAAALAPPLRTAWAPPFEQDKAAGYDYNPGKLNTEAVKIGGATTAYTASRVGDLPEFKVELTKPAGKKALTVRLVKGPAPHEWLVSEVLEPKG
jgi:hypothetical protein